MTTAKSLTYLTGIAGLIDWDLKVGDGHLYLTCNVKRKGETKKYGLSIDGITPIDVTAYFQLAAASMRECIDGDLDTNSTDRLKVVAGVNEFRRRAGLADLCQECQVIELSQVSA